MRIALGSDHAGFALKQAIAERLRSAGHESDDCGCNGETSCDYPDFGIAAAQQVSSGTADRAVLVCGTGIGMSMTANKLPGVRAALVHDRLTARMSREHNNANVLCLGARVLDAELALELVDLWLRTEFEGGRHRRRVDKIDALDTRRDA